MTKPSWNRVKGHQIKSSYPFNQIRVTNVLFFSLNYLGNDLLELLDIDKTKTTFQDKSATLKSTNADYNTPPESPVMPHPLFKTIGESIDKPPVPPPR